MIETAVGEVNEESDTDADITLGPDPLTRSEKGLKAAFHILEGERGMTWL